MRADRTVPIDERLPVVPVATCTPSFEVGTGEARFQPLADLDPVEIHCGPQGGFHVIGALRACGDVPQTVEITFRVYEEATGEPIGLGVYPPFPLASDGCCGSLANIWAYLDAVDALDALEVLEGEVMILELTATGPDGVDRVATARGVGVPADDCSQP